MNAFKCLIQCVKLVSGIAVFTWLKDSEPLPHEMDKCSHEKRYAK